MPAPMTSSRGLPDIWSCAPGCALCSCEARVHRARLVVVGALAIDLHAHVATLHGRPLRLRQMEYDLLVHLASEPQRVFRKSELLRAVWGYPEHRHPDPRQPRQPLAQQAQRQSAGDGSSTCAAWGTA